MFFLIIVWMSTEAPETFSNPQNHSGVSQAERNSTQCKLVVAMMENIYNTASATAMLTLCFVLFSAETSTAACEPKATCGFREYHPFVYTLAGTREMSPLFFGEKRGIDVDSL